MDVDAEHENAPKVPVPHESLWFPSGNVVLSTELILFKVHKDILSMQSSVFKGMFDFPAVDGTQMIENGAGDIPELYEGLPMVNLVGDKGEDVMHLLRAVYERQCVFFLPCCSASLMYIILFEGITTVTMTKLPSKSLLRFWI